MRHERGEAKIDHLVKDWHRLLLIFHHQARMTEANARGVDEACRERRVSRMELARAVRLGLSVASYPRVFIVPLMPGIGKRLN